MNCHRILPSFGRAAAADDAWTCNHLSTCDARLAVKRGIGLFRIRAAVIVIAILCGVPGAMHAQHNRNNRKNGSREQLSALTCKSGSLTGAGSDACTVTLTESASSGGFAVNLASSSSSAKVPASVTVASGAASAGFTLTAAAVSTAQTATLTASDSSNKETYSLQLKPASSGTAALTLGSTSVAFGNVDLNTPATQTVKLTSSGTAAVTISAAAIQGTGFTMSGITTPVTLSPSQTATLDLQFDPKAAGADTGAVTLSSNGTGGTSTISLTGTGTTAAGYQVALNWNAPTNSGVAVTGYNVYRAASGDAYQLLNSSVNKPTTYTDTTVQGGASYTYEVMSVDAAGAQSNPSNVYTAAIP